MPYPSVNLEPAPKPAVASPIVAFRALRRAFTHSPVKCVVCGATTETFADAEHADGTITGWAPVCEKCAKAKAPKKPEPAPAPGPVAPPAPPAPSSAPAE